mmetsp:Transcript_90735/g.194608  ORF Transcript_90735/g.194608 Transcript_90735/m.194608 type:complete len:224 (-) Transcript_90735:892-1563(-)
MLYHTQGLHVRRGIQSPLHEVVHEVVKRSAIAELRPDGLHGEAEVRDTHLLLYTLLSTARHWRLDGCNLRWHAALHRVLQGLNFDSHESLDVLASLGETQLPIEAGLYELPTSQVGFSEEVVRLEPVLIPDREHEDIAVHIIREVRLVAPRRLHSLLLDARLYLCLGLALDLALAEWIRIAETQDPPVCLTQTSSAHHSDLERTKTLLAHCARLLLRPPVSRI